MKRDVLYLGAVIAIAAAIIQLGPGLLLAAIGPAWALRRGSLRPALTAPFAVLALALVVPAMLDALGGHCPREGLDQLDECNTLASAGIVVFLGGVIALKVSLVAAACAALLRAVTIAVDLWRRPRTRNPARR